MKMQNNNPDLNLIKMKTHKKNANRSDFTNNKTTKKIY